MIVFFVCGDSPHLAFMAVSHVYKKNSTRLKPLPLLLKFHCTYTHTHYITYAPLTRKKMNNNFQM